jgi:hypothetical protein
MKKAVLLFALLLGLLSACIPATVLGSSPLNPIETRFGLSSEEILPGSTWYFVSQYNPGAFGYSLSERNNQLDYTVSTTQMPRKGQKGSSNVTNSFKVKAVDAPTGWEVRLQRAYLQREVTDVDGYTYTFNDSMHFVFAVSVPQGAARGAETIVVTVQRGTTSQEIPLMVIVQSDSPQADSSCDDCTQS